MYVSENYFLNLSTRIDNIGDLMQIVDTRMCMLLLLLAESENIDPQSKYFERYSKKIEELINRIEERTREENERIDELNSKHIGNAFPEIFDMIKNKSDKS